MKKICKFNEKLNKKFDLDYCWEKCECGNNSFFVQKVFSKSLYRYVDVFLVCSKCKTSIGGYTLIDIEKMKKIPKIKPMSKKEFKNISNKIEKRLIKNKKIKELTKNEK